MPTSLPQSRVTSAVHMAVVRMAEAHSPSAFNRDWLAGRRFFDEGQEYEVMRVGRKRWKKPAIGDVALGCVVNGLLFSGTSMVTWHLG